MRSSGILDRRGQTVMPEYIVVFFLVIGAAVAIGTYLQRGYQARIHEARKYVAKMATAECDAACLRAAEIKTGRVPAEYEPYYGNIDTTVNRSRSDGTGLASGGLTGQYHKVYDESTDVSSKSIQLPPKQSEKDIYGK